MQFAILKPYSELDENMQAWSAGVKAWDGSIGASPNA
jgi:hypothetical protein